MKRKSYLLSKCARSVLRGLGLLLVAGTSVSAQNMILANPAETTDFRSAFVNPAVLSFQRAQAALGAKVFHLGFADESSPFRQGFVNIGLPFGISKQIGLGLQAQYFNTPLFSQSNISFAMSRRLGYNYAIGVKVNLFSRGFNRDNFDLVDADDPVFRSGTSQWAGTVGAGLFAFPLPYLSFAIGIDHLNRADISLAGDGVNQPLALHLGAVLNVGLFQAAVSGFYEDGRWIPQTSIKTLVHNKGYAMLGFTENSIQAEGQLQLSGPLSLNYSYEYTLFGDAGIGQGSHAVSLIHQFGRGRALPKFELPDEYKVEFRPPDRSMNQESGFYVYSAVDRLEIVEKRLHRQIADDVSKAQLAQLSQYELGVLDSSRTDSATPYEGRAVDLGLIPATLDAPISRKYQRFMGEVAEELIHNDKLKARVITGKESYLRAAGLRRHLRVDAESAGQLGYWEPGYDSVEDSLRANRKIGSGPVRTREALTSLSARSTTFQITPVTRMPRPKTWRLLIRDSNGNIAKTFTGSGLPITEVRWDWHTDSGDLVRPGLYNYHLEWIGPDETTNKTELKYISVQKLLRHITIEVTNHPKRIGADADEVNIILKD